MVTTTVQPRSQAFNKSIPPPGFLRKFIQNIHYVFWRFLWWFFKKKKTMVFCFTYCHSIVYTVKKGCFSHWNSKSGGIRIEVLLLSVLPVEKILPCLFSSCFYVIYFLTLLTNLRFWILVEATILMRNAMPGILTTVHTFLVSLKNAVSIYWFIECQIFALE